MRRADQANERYVTNYRLTVVGNTLVYAIGHASRVTALPGVRFGFEKQGASESMGMFPTSSCGVVE